MFSKTNSGKKSSANSSANLQQDAARKAMPKPIAAPSILGRNLTTIGEIKTDGDVQIDGRHDGNIVAANLTIGEQGVVNGDIKAKAVYIRGKVVGKISASLVEMAETANVQADIKQDKLTIANGAYFDGKSTRRAPVPQKPATTSSTPEIEPKAVKSA